MTELHSSLFLSIPKVISSRKTFLTPNSSFDDPSEVSSLSLKEEEGDPSLSQGPPRSLRTSLRSLTLEKRRMMRMKRRTSSSSRRRGGGGRQLRLLPLNGLDHSFPPSEDLERVFSSAISTASVIRNIPYTIEGPAHVRSEVSFEVWVELRRDGEWRGTVQPVHREE